MCRLSLSNFKGMRLFDVRVYANGSDGSRVSIPEGVSLRGGDAAGADRGATSRAGGGDVAGLREVAETATRADSVQYAS